VLVGQQIAVACRRREFVGYVLDAMILVVFVGKVVMELSITIVLDIF
jgi:hypothetical protein